MHHSVTDQAKVKLELWTIAYRKPHANRFQRVTNWTGTWQEAVDMSGKFREANPELQVWYVSTREAEQTGYVPADDIGNILTDSGKRVRIIDDGKLDLTLSYLISSNSHVRS